jgi:serine/threonine-protein kinase
VAGNVNDRPDAKTTKPSEGEAPLTLADETDGSTMPVEEESSSSSSGDQAARSGPVEPQAAASGGFETLLGKLVVQRGLATSEEVELCRALRREAAEGDGPPTLGDLLVERGFITARQHERLKGELEAKKPSQQIPGFTITRKLGSGAMATVFLARQLSLDRPVAIKVLPKKLSANSNFIERFYKEGRAAAQLNHPNIVGAYDVGRAGEHHYFVMEFVEGPTVFDRIARKGRVEEAEAIRVVTQVAEALRHAHERGFIHRDIKPKNIMITREGVVKLADLGLARAMSDKEAAQAEAGRAYGTPYYISPEQIRGELKIGPAADIYGLGATFYHMVTGRVPFEGKNPSSVMHKHLKTPLTPPDHLNPRLSAGCAQVIEMMMAKDCRDRYQSDDDLLTDLRLIAECKPPHFAHRSIDLSGVGPARTPGPPGPAPATAAAAMAVSAVHSPAFMLVLVLMVVSVLANAVLLVALLAS